MGLPQYYGYDRVYRKSQMRTAYMYVPYCQSNIQSMHTRPPYTNIPSVHAHEKLFERTPKLTLTPREEKLYKHKPTNPTNPKTEG